MASNEKAPRAKHANITENDNFPVSFKGKQYIWKFRKTAKDEFLFQANLATKTLINTYDTDVASSHFNSLCTADRCQALRHDKKKLEDHIEVFARASAHILGICGHLWGICGRLWVCFFGAHVAYCAQMYYFP